jgi:predicted short-subunit dehydrogenase-like oxidoreductase (DUF2520 family)
VAATREGVDRPEGPATGPEERNRRLVSPMRELERELPTHPARAAEAPPIPTLAVIGPGRVGRSVATAAERAHIATGLAGRDDTVEACRGSGAALLCVPDAEIVAACEVVATAVPPVRFVGHTSGTTGLDALTAARAAGAELFSLHPLQTIPDGHADLTGAPCAVAGSGADAVALAWELAARIGMRPFEVPEEHRAIYHAAAVMASNLLVALEESASELLDRAGIDAASRELLSPLVLRTAANWAERGSEALTGPAARGDTETIERHLRALEEVAPDLLPVYESLTSRAQAVAPAPEAVR